MNNHLKSELLDNDPRLLKQLGNKLIDLFFEHALDDKNYPLNDYSDTSLIDNNPFTPKGVLNVDKLLHMIDKQILDQSIYRTRRNYLKFVDNGSSPINMIGSIINSLLNQNLTAHLTHSPSATFHEVALIKYVREIVGYPYKKITSINDIGGYFVSGGMMANFAALLVARNSIQSNAQSDGVTKKMKLIVPSFACHFSAWSSMGWLGYGENNTVHVKTNNFKYDLTELENTIQSIKKEGDEILAVVASVGDSYSMSIENILEVRKICDRYNIWLHGDGANCGILVFAKKYRKYVKDFHLCDSVSLDPHKLLGMNYPNSIFLCKDYTKFNTVISNWNIINKKGSFDLGMITPFLNSRGFDSLKLWLLLKYFGTDGVARIIDNKIDATKEIHRQLADGSGSF